MWLMDKAVPHDFRSNVAEMFDRESYMRQKREGSCPNKLRERPGH